MRYSRTKTRHTSKSGAQLRKSSTSQSHGKSVVYSSFASLTTSSPTTTSLNVSTQSIAPRALVSPTTSRHSSSLNTRKQCFSSVSTATPVGDITNLTPQQRKALEKEKRAAARGGKQKQGKPPAPTEDELNQGAAASEYTNYAINHTVYTNTRSEDFHNHQQKYPNWKPYHDSIQSTTTLGDFVQKYKDIEPGSRLESDDGIVLNARIGTKRVASQKLFFYDVHSQHADFSQSQIQVICSQRRLDEHDHSVASLLKKGDWVSFTGFPGKSETGELSLIATKATLLSPCLQLPPTNLVDPNLRFRSRHLDMMVNRDEVMEIFRIRTGVFHALRSYLNARGGVEVETPILWTQSGGATARPFHTTSNAFGASLPLSLRIAPELFLKQLVIGGIEQVYEIGKVFRNEGIDATHNPEFTTCELYQAHANYQTMMDFTEDVLRHIVLQVKGKLQVDTVPPSVIVPSSSSSSSSSSQNISSEQSIHETDAQGHSDIASKPNEVDPISIDFSKPFPRLDVIDTLKQHGITLPENFNDPEAIPSLAKICQDRGFQVSPPFTNARYLDKLISEIIEPMCIQPTFIIHQPVCLSPLAKHLPSNPNVTERFELFINTKEYANAYSELNIPTEQLERFVVQHKQKVTRDSSGNDVVDEESHPVDLPYCESLQYGLPPTAGWGIGLDRLVMLLSQQHNIRDVLLFPVMKPQH